MRDAETLTECTMKATCVEGRLPVAEVFGEAVTLLHSHLHLKPLPPYPQLSPL